MEDVSKKIVFIVDDDEFLLDMYVLKFQESGFAIEVAKGGEEALEKLRAGLKPDVMLLDIVMPHLDGFELLRIVKKEQLSPRAKIIMLTNLGQKEDVDRGLRLGADDYIVKAQFTPTEIVQRVQAILGNTKNDASAS
ncbi:MAG: response regulator [Parcubacteria group bacterium]|nr:response regulator [Parcubacteria group bacterium]